MSQPNLLSKLMNQATALTRSGRLAEATEAIQRALRRDAAADTAANDSANDKAHTDAVVLDGLVREVEEPVAERTTHTETKPETETETETDPAAAKPSRQVGPARFEEHAFATEHGPRHYKLFTPGGLDESAPAPLVVMLHGCKQNPDDFAAGTRMNALAEAQGFRVLYPAQAPRSNMQRCWNWFQPADQKRGSGEPALLAAMTHEVMRANPVDPTRVYIAGLSAGGAMAAIMANEYPDVFAAVGVHSGLPQGAASDVGSAFSAMKQGPGRGTARSTSRRVPIIVFHGDADTTVNPLNGERIVSGHTIAKVLKDSPDKASANGRDFVRTLYEDEASRVVAEHWLVHGAGHAWSGGSSAGSYADETGPDASREMLRFFMEQKRA